VLFGSLLIHSLHADLGRGPSETIFAAGNEVAPDFWKKHALFSFFPNYFQFSKEIVFLLLQIRA